jgi:SAM-dependent methyltransferase
MWLDRRDPRRELMDVEEGSPEQVARALRFLRFVNRWLGGCRAVLWCLSRLTLPPRPLILDVASGAADIPAAIRRRWPGARVVALDVNRQVLRAAAPARGVRRVRADARRLPFRAVDVVVCSEFFHHLADGEAAALLRQFDAIARHGIVINDLLRRRRAYLWTRLLVSFSGSRWVRHDGPLSVRRAFAWPEVLRLREASGCSYLRATRHFGHRFCLWGGRC